MNKTILIVASLFISALLIASVSAQEIWQFNNFVNKYKVYSSSSCNVLKTKSCPSEFGWQGKTMKFTFKLDSSQTLTDNLKFNFYVSWFIDQRPIDVSVNGYRIAQGFIVNGNGEYSFEFSKSLLKPGKNNEIKIEMKNIKVGYGRPPQGFVLGSVSFEDSS